LDMVRGPARYADFGFGRYWAGSSLNGRETQ
jgi:hypothetical protein